MKLTMTSSLPFSAVFVVSELAACGGKSIDTSDNPVDQGGSAQGGSGNRAGSSAGGKIGVAGSSSGGTSSAGTSSGGTGSAGTAQGGSAGSSSVCDTFGDDGGSFIGVDIVNKTSAVIYVGQPKITCEVEPLFSVASANGTALPSPSRCRSACGAAIGGCTAICLYPAAVELAPGASYSTSWDGLFDTNVQLPEACVTPERGSTSCQQARLIQPGTFSFSARAGSQLDCDQTGCGSGCQPDGTGNCTTQGALIGGDLRAATTTVQLDASFGVYAHILPPPGANIPAPAPSRVQIVFAD